MNIAHWFKTYREHHSLVNVYKTIQTISDQKDSIFKALLVSIEYFSQTNFTPDSLISSICRNIISQSEVHYSKIALLQTFSDFIFEQTYWSWETDSDSSSSVFFINELHDYCDSIEKLM